MHESIKSSSCISDISQQQLLHWKYYLKNREASNKTETDNKFSGIDEDDIEVWLISYFLFEGKHANSHPYTVNPALL